jgi:hypothetical protein
VQGLFTFCSRNPSPIGDFSNHAQATVRARTIFDQFEYLPTKHIITQRHPKTHDHRTSRCHITIISDRTEKEVSPNNKKAAKHKFGS